jgi:hypothetical protein
MAWALPVLLLAGCGGEPAADEHQGDDSSFTLTYTLEGGADRFQTRLVVSSQGWAHYQRHRPRPFDARLQLEAEAIEAVRRLALDPAFLELDPVYAPPSRLADGYRYTILVETPTLRRQVVAEDGVALPRAFLVLREGLAAVTRAVQAGGGLASGAPTR